MPSFSRHRRTAGILLLTPLLFTPLLFLNRTLAAGGASIAFDPPAGSADVGNPVELSLLIDSSENVQGADIRFEFDPAILSVVDANGGAQGVQVAPGDCPAPDFIILNDVNNTTGSGAYATVETVTSCLSGTVFSVTFTCLAPGSSPVTISESTLSDPDGFTIAHTVSHGSVVCGSATSTPSPTASATHTPTTGPSPTATRTPTPTATTGPGTPTATPAPDFIIYLPIVDREP